MFKRVISIAMLVCSAMLIAPSEARAQQTLNFTLGYFVPHGEDGRVFDDVLNVNRTFLVFEIDHFNGPSVGAEWLVPFNQFIEGGIGVSYSKRTVPSVYQDFVDSNGTEIYQEMRLRLVPTTFSVRFVPTGQRSPVQPYFGAGLGIIAWRYSETGEFIDFSAGREIFRATYSADGAETGLVVLGGIRFAGDPVSGGFEIRYQDAEADLDPRFAGSKLDLGGWTYNVTVGLRF